MKTNECFECGATEDLQQHHIVPRSRGGTKTVPLCTQCHGKAHGRDLKGLEHSRLTKEGLERASARGQKLGFALHQDKVAQKAGKKSGIVRNERAHQHVLQYGPLIEFERKQNNLSFAKIATIFTDKKYPTSYQAHSCKWVASRVLSIYKKWEQIPIQIRAHKNSITSRARAADDHARQWGPVVEIFFNEGLSWNETCLKLDELGAPTSATAAAKDKATKWTIGSLQRLKDRYQEIKNNT